MERDDFSKEPGLVREILRYFVRHPSRIDSCDDIVRWRLAEERIRITVVEVSESLKWLVEKKFVKFIQRAGIEPLYCLNESKLADATRFLMREGRALGNRGKSA